MIPILIGVVAIILFILFCYILGVLKNTFGSYGDFTDNKNIWSTIILGAELFKDILLILLTIVMLIIFLYCIGKIIILMFM